MQAPLATAVSCSALGTASPATLCTSGMQPSLQRAAQPPRGAAASTPRGSTLSALAPTPLAPGMAAAERQPARRLHSAFLQVPGEPRQEARGGPVAAQSPAASAQAQHSGGGSGKQQQAPRVPPVEARRYAVERTPPETFRVVGVSFEGRQELLAAIDKGAAVALVREPGNPHDPDAVAVQTLHGHRLGYISRDETYKLPQTVTFGRVESIGAEANTGNIGLTVTVHPLLPALTVDALPEALEQVTALSSTLPEADWDALRRAAYRRAGYRCDITGGAGDKYPVVGNGMWHVDDARKTVQLLGVAALAPEVAAAKNLARLTPNSGAATAALATLKAINEWTDEELGAYLRHTDAQRALRSSAGDWVLDASWLESQGVAVPDKLASMASAH